MGRLGPTELLILLAIVVVLFGGSRIAKLGKELGEGMRSFKRGASDDAPPAALPVAAVSSNDERNG